jgi:transcriptional regulator with XRE-family HTH domain
MANELERLSRHLALNLTSLRNKRGLSQGALAKLSGVPRSTLAHLESGAGNPSLANLARISAGLQISLEELLSRPRSRIRLIPATEVRVEKRGGGRRKIPGSPGRCARFPRRSTPFLSQHGTIDGDLPQRSRLSSRRFIGLAYLTHQASTSKRIPFYCNLGPIC